MYTENNEEHKHLPDADLALKPSFLSTDQQLPWMHLQ